MLNEVFTITVQKQLCTVIAKQKTFTSNRDDPKIHEKKDHSSGTKKKDLGKNLQSTCHRCP